MTINYMKAIHQSNVFNGRYRRDRSDERKDVIFYSE